jgi:hypothetical protein
MSRWFRFYDDALNDPKVQMLPGDLFKAWINLLCMASKGAGKIVTAEVSFALRVTPEQAETFIADLIDRNLIERGKGNTLTPHNWALRQFKSDVSNERVQRHRERKRNVTGSDQETPPETDTEQRTEAETDQNREISLRESARTREGDPISEDWTCDYGSGLAGLGFSHIQCLAEQPKFVAHYRANRETRPDWGACFVKWMLGARQRGDIAPAPSTAPVTAWLGKPNTPEWKAWKSHYEGQGHNRFVLSQMKQIEDIGVGSLTFANRWPPGHEPADQGEQTRPAPVPQCPEIVPPEPKVPADDGIPEILKRRKAG